MTRLQDDIAKEKEAFLDSIEDLLTPEESVLSGLIDVEVRASLGLSGVDVSDMSDENLEKYTEAFFSDCEKGGIDVSMLKHQGNKLFATALRRHSLKYPRLVGLAERMEATVRKLEN